MGSLNTAHLHLLLNHVPTVGTVVGVGLVLLSFLRRNDHLAQASLEIFFIIALLTLPAYLSGAAAAQTIEAVDGVSVSAVTTHHDAALLAFIWMQITGLVAWVGLWRRRRGAEVPGGIMGTVFVLSTVTLALMAHAATLGGEIRHPEILPPGAPAGSAPIDWLTAAAVGQLVSEFAWVWPAAECLHFLGLCLAFGVLLVVNLRILGAMRGLAFASLHRLLPWGVVGFGVNFVTGMLFFISSSQQYSDNVAFNWKVVFLGLAGAHFLYLTVFHRSWRLQQGEDAAFLDKAVAGTAIFVWVGVIYWGRMLPFIGGSV